MTARKMCGRGLLWLVGAVLCVVVGALCGLSLAVAGKFFNAELSFDVCWKTGAVAMLLVWLAFLSLRLCNKYSRHVIKVLTIGEVYMRRAGDNGEETHFEITARELPGVILWCDVEAAPRDLRAGEAVRVRIPKARVRRGVTYAVWSVNR